MNETIHTYKPFVSKEITKNNGVEYYVLFVAVLATTDGRQVSDPIICSGSTVNRMICEYLKLEETPEVEAWPDNICKRIIAGWTQEQIYLHMMKQYNNHMVHGHIWLAQSYKRLADICNFLFGGFIIFV